MISIVTFITDDVQASNGFGQPAEEKVRLHVKRKKKIFIV